jgi:hypothetical protein
LILGDVSWEMGEVVEVLLWRVWGPVENLVNAENGRMMLPQFRRGLIEGWDAHLPSFSTQLSNVSDTDGRDAYLRVSMLSLL